MTGRFQPGCTPHNKGRKGHRSHKEQPYVVETQGQKLRAQSEFMKMVRGLSTMSGCDQGIKELDIPMLIAGAGSEDLETWAKKARGIAKTLNQLAKELKKVKDDAAKRTEHASDQGEGEGTGGPPDCAESLAAATSESSG
jgi:hypothetical protein